MNTFVINPKNSIARIGFATLISGISLGIMWSNKSDASLINVSGSLRYQSYRFWYEMNHAPENIELRLEEYRASLHSPELQALNSSYLLPKEVKARINA